MPSIVSAILREQIRLLKPLLARMSIQADRAAQDSIGALGARALSSRLEFTAHSFPNFEGCMITPHELLGSGVVLYLHGGGYTSGSLKYAQGFGGVLAVETGMHVFCAAYRLAPEHPFPAALDDALEAYRYLLELGYPPERITLAGESAGGGLVFCLLHRLREENRALPGRVVAISPWTDLTIVGESYATNEKLEPGLAKESLEYYAKLYAGETEPEHPFISPVYGDFTGYPPALIIAGADEILLDDSIRLRDRYLECGSECHLHVEEGMWHVYVLFAVPEARAALDLMRAFLYPERNLERSALQ